MKAITLTLLDLTSYFLITVCYLVGTLSEQSAMMSYLSMIHLAFELLRDTSCSFTKHSPFNLENFFHIGEKPKTLTNAFSLKDKFKNI